MWSPRPKPALLVLRRPAGKVLRWLGEDGEESGHSNNISIPLSLKNAGENKAVSLQVTHLCFTVLLHTGTDSPVAVLVGWSV